MENLQEISVFVTVTFMTAVALGVIIGTIIYKNHNTSKEKKKN
jgi:hypothetical protein